MKTQAWVAGALLIVLAGCGSDDGTITPTVGPITESVYANGFVKAQGQYQVFPLSGASVLRSCRPKTYLHHHGRTLQVR